MKTRADKAPYLPLVMAGIVIVLFSTAAIARMLGWGPNSAGESGDVLVLEQAAPATTSAPRTKLRCPECGEIVSMREIARHDENSGLAAAGEVTAGDRDGTRVNSIRSHEITVRMADGSRRMIEQANPASWRPGERVIVIGGVTPSNR